jgi:hypothetical protein
MPRVDEDFRLYFCLRCTTYKNVKNGGWVNWNDHFDIIEAEVGTAEIIDSW